MSIADCFSKIKISPDKRAEIQQYIKQAKGDEVAGLRNYILSLNGKMDSVRGQLIEKGYEVGYSPAQRETVVSNEILSGELNQLQAKENPTDMDLRRIEVLKKQVRDSGKPVSYREAKDSLLNIIKSTGKADLHGKDAGLVRDIRQALKMTREDAKKMFDNLIDNEGVDPLYLETLVVLSKGSEATPSEILMLKDKINFFTEEKAKARKEKQEARQKKIEQEISQVSDAIELLGSREGETRGQKTAKVSSIYGAEVFDTLPMRIDKLMGKSPEARELRDQYMDRVYEATLERDRVVYDSKKKFTDTLVDTYGLRDENGKLKTSDLKNLFLDLGDKKYEFQYIPVGKSKPKTIKLSRGEMISIISLSYNQTAYERLTTEDGNAYPSSLIEDILTEMQDADLAMAENMLDLYSDFLPKIKALYEEIEGKPFTGQTNYTPIPFDDSIISPVQDFINRSADSFSRAKFRGKKGAIKIQNFDRVYMSYAYGASHYLTHAEVMRDIKDVFRSDTVNKAITDAMGASYTHAFNEAIDNHDKGFTEIGKGWTAAALKLNANAVSSFIKFSPNMVLKQATSAVAAVSETGFGGFGKYGAQFLGDFIPTLKVLRQSKVLQERADVIEQMIINAERNSSELSLLDEPTWTQWMSIATKMGDRTGILLGGGVVYKYYKAQDMSDDQALKKFEKWYNETQQSSGTAFRSNMQNSSNAFLRIMLSLKSSQLALVRTSVLQARRAYRGEISKRKAVETFVALNTVAPLLFTIAANALNPEEEDLYVSLLTSNASAVPVIGDAYSVMVGRAFGKKWMDPSMGNVNKAANDFQKAVLRSFSEIENNGLTAEAFYESFFAIGQAVGIAKGVPVAKIQNAGEGVYDMFNEEELKGFLRTMGYTEKTVDRIMENGILSD